MLANHLPNTLEDDKATLHRTGLELWGDPLDRNGIEARLDALEKQFHAIAATTDSDTREMLLRLDALERTVKA